MLNISVVTEIKTCEIRTRISVAKKSLRRWSYRLFRNPKYPTRVKIAWKNERPKYGLHKPYFYLCRAEKRKKNVSEIPINMIPQKKYFRVGNEFFKLRLKFFSVYNPSTIFDSNVLIKSKEWVTVNANTALIWKTDWKIMITWNDASLAAWPLRYQTL